MTAYWDALKREVQEASQQLSDDAFVEAVVDIETRVIRAVSLTTGDREFPDDLRRKIQGIIGINAIDFGRYVFATECSEGREPVNARTKAWLLTMRYSILLEELHGAFHQVASRRAANRYDAHFTDDPTSFLHAREAAIGGGS